MRPLFVAFRALTAPLLPNVRRRGPFRASLPERRCCRTFVRLLRDPPLQQLPLDCRHSKTFRPKAHFQDAKPCQNLNKAAILDLINSILSSTLQKEDSGILLNL
mmetsp:Transcript_17259/g.61357  ORF Transcript_17259/g.61357 Transcript_17259/m.61357 type:complete len:104 (-) Transcript_17259:275-586(-)